MSLNLHHQQKINRFTYKNSNMENTEKKVHFSRRFLNKEGHYSDSTIISSVTIGNKYYVSEDITLKIRDCNNQISLELSLDEDEGGNSFENSIYKLDVLIQELTLLKVKIKEAKPIYDKMVADKKKEDEEREKQSENNETDS